jgi:DNA-binding NarL/FixJ family response regulator
VVILSSSDRDPDVQQAYELGANSYVVKQFDPARPGEYLVDAARYWIGLNRAERG